MLIERQSVANYVADKKIWTLSVGEEPFKEHQDDW